MKIQIKRIDKSLSLPTYQTDGAVGFDFLSRENQIIKAGEIGLIPGNVIIKVPKGYMLVLASRSSTPGKKGLMTPHGIGIIDMDYHGPNDEIKIQVYNFRNEDVKIEKGDRIAQGIFVRVDKFDFEEVDDIRANSRGGFGSTG